MSVGLIDNNPGLLLSSSNMKARELFNRRVSVAEQEFAELVLWEVPEPLSGSKHRYKYRLAFEVAG